MTNNNVFKTIFQWFVYSSQNPSELSLTLKGFIPLLLLLGVGNIIPPATAQSFADSLVALVVGAGQLISAAITMLGLIRKIYNSFSGN